MATSVAQGFNELRAGFDLTDLQDDFAKTKIQNIREFMGKHFEMAHSPISVGSYARKTIIRVERDVDIVAPLDYPTYKDRYDNYSSAFLYMVRDALNEEFGSTTVSSKKVAVKLDFSTFAVDVVPCFNRSGGGYFMPNGNGGWMATNPPFHTEFMRLANISHDYKLKVLVKLMKFWNIANGHHLSSLHVELMTEKIWRNSDFEENLYSYLVAETLRCMESWTRSSFADPWESGNAIDVQLSSDERDMAVRMLNEDAENARKAEEFRKNGQIEKAFERWGVIYHHQFPAYG